MAAVSSLWPVQGCLLTSCDSIKHKWTSKEGWIGEFPLSYICTPQLPCSFRGKRSAKPTPFYALDADMPIMAAVVVSTS